MNVRYIKNKLLASSLLGMFIVYLLTVPVCFAQEKKAYQSSEGNFSFIVPDGYNGMSPNVLSAFSKLLSVDFSSGFMSSGNNNYFTLIKVRKNGKLDAGDLRMLSATAVKRTAQNWNSVFKDVQKLNADEFFYDESRHIRYDKSEIDIPSESTRIPGVNVLIFSNYGAVAMAFYSANNFDASTVYFNQIIDSFKFDPGYEYPDQTHKGFYRSLEGHFSFTIPDGWLEFSEGQISEIASVMNQLPGTKAKLETGFFDKTKPSRYLLIHIKKNGRWSESKIQKMLFDGTLKQAMHDREKIFKDIGGVAFNSLFYDSKEHVLYMKAEIGNGVSKAISANAAMLSSYGLALIAVYSSEDDTDGASKYLKQIVDSFSFDGGYHYGSIKNNRNGIVFFPKSVSGFVLLFMSIFLYGGRFHWKNFRGTKGYFIKSVIALVAAVISSELVEFFSSVGVSRNFIDTGDVILAIVLGVFWYKAHKKRSDPKNGVIKNRGLAMNLKKILLENWKRNLIWAVAILVPCYILNIPVYPFGLFFYCIPICIVPMIKKAEQDQKDANKETSQWPGFEVKKDV